MTMHQLSLCIRQKRIGNTWTTYFWYNSRARAFPDSKDPLDHPAFRKYWSPCNPPGGWRYDTSAEQCGAVDGKWKRGSQLFIAPCRCQSNQSRIGIAITAAYNVVPVEIRPLLQGHWTVANRVTTMRLQWSAGMTIPRRRTGWIIRFSKPCSWLLNVTTIDHKRVSSEQIKRRYIKKQV